MKVSPLTGDLEQTFWSHVNQDPLNHYFFIYDWKLHRDNTEFFLATEKGQIRGLMLIYRNFVVQLRGNREAVGLLLSQTSLEKVELQAPLECEDLVLGKYRPAVKEHMVLMYLRKGDENIQLTAAPVRLGADDADEIAEVMRKADPVGWGEIKAERIKQTIEGTIWLGIKQDQKLVSVGQAHPVDFGGTIGIAATREGYRNRGYATSIVSALVKEILKTSSLAVIHVLRGNMAAIRAYSKVGFKPYRTYFFIKT